MNSASKNGSIEPFIIHYVHGRYLIFEVSILKHLREVHHICGVLIGTLPQISQQNVFLGLPLQIMIEEAAYLVRHGHAYIVDDQQTHRATVSKISVQELAKYEADSLEEKTRKDAASRALQRQKKREALEKRGLTHLLEQLSIGEDEADASMPKIETRSAHIDTVSPRIIYRPPLPAATDQDDEIQLTSTDARYNLFAHLHEKDYFLTPGLRFGAQYVAYPGDPLRFHSHFVASGHDWDAPISFMDVVGGGRLGTGVKKAWLIGGKDPEDEQMKCFTVEWAGM
ncbi:TRNA-splicing endonuclease subunit sen34 [Taphrina deformans PYCC 5710]|uniref:tRNA-splicing endonuclease subunit Sen34 n=1 Tax=Taphrina deformans (strain PYCC 5710 / ATCC 11124 / CBS 356.35 / IMI 108563 / JCM 9778 / NBRC 8474) TaxID=1097556 RepID=R4XC24_TAPDE|nr:TRNA-splicing endonuclease subunit sen34 [Taphrina deformans PYCC 5710]|eukprot:CCG83371.1 TRNA-splicing endonuclease subunit sen34 [Taphrina deformans PYCC 5710]